MYRLSLIIFLLGLTFSLYAQSPHGADFKMDCAACHTADSWEIPAHLWDFKEERKGRTSNTTGWVIAEDTLRFNHYNTPFPLRGQHEGVDCRSCHETLIFSEANTECISCHTDMHNQTVGSDCIRCHSVENWLVDNITELHADNGFPLLGVHAALSCNDCHLSESALQFERIGNDCINCHLDDFTATTSPNHRDAGFSTDCTLCHTVDGSDWETDKINHDFFPLTKGHEIEDCAKCHTGGDFTNTSTDCVACHQQEFDNSTNPNHQSGGFPTDCISCHTTDIGWMPADFALHDNEYFPIYSGAHEGEWSACTDCHTNSSNYAEFTCITCHINPETDEGHDEVSGYVYESTACLACHPTGDTESSFDHNDTNFPLTGAHLSVDCASCHTNGYAGTPTDCAACHTIDFEQTTNPDHNVLGLSTDCASCHTTEPEWNPATFEIHDDFYVLNGAHAAISNDCVACHAGDYNNTPNTCFGCHSADYNQASNPDHAAAQFPTNCESCHNESTWAPSTFDHEVVYPLTGAHDVIADDCVACHAGDYTNTPNTCVGCHQQDYDQSVNPNHTVLNLPTDCESCHTTEPDWMPATFDIHDDYYVLNGAHAAISNDCAACHNGDYNNTPNTCFSCHSADYNQASNPDHAAAQFPTNCESCHNESTWAPSTFDHEVVYPLTGAHDVIADDCFACHAGDYTNTPNTCVGCHQGDYDQSVNPNHTVLNLPTDCESCHTTELDWMPATFDIHDDYYVLNGAHAAISNDCATCHNGDYNNTPNTCFGCHAEDYTNTVDPNHTVAQFSTDCQICHTESEWIPAAFDHDAEYFPIYSGAHEGEWSACVDCHTNPSNYAEFTCVTCHMNPETDDDHDQVSGYIYESTACLACHPMGDVDNVFDHNNTAFPLTGAHIATDCISCHSTGYEGTPTDCASCHTPDFNQTTNPNHTAIGLSTDCVSCHTTEPGWSPAAFDIHDDYYVLNGAHVAISNDCASCHNGDYNNTPNTCAGCHTTDYNQTSNPDHAAAQFPTDCESCHSEDAWVPSSFDHEAFYPLTGAHNVIADDCVACHAGDYNNTPNTCVGCHQGDYDQSVNPNHTVLNLPTDCESCHTTEPDWMPATFDIHNDYYALNGAHAVISNDCAACHNGDYNNTPNTCFGCHAEDYTNTVDPNHTVAQFSTDCQSCHTESEWVPAAFDHDAQYFPIYSGAHEGEWSECIDCHTNPSNYAEFTCITCHMNPETDDDHDQVSGYVYESTACLACHPMGDVDNIFDHNNTAFPLTGAHIATDCISCHSTGYEGTPTDCSSCHTPDFNQTTNPNHTAIGLSTDCVSCHTTEPGWSPAAFDIHDDYYVLNGAHALISNDCATCHNGDYNNTPNTCAACHTVDYNQTSNPDHAAAQFPTDCESCHSEDAWVPSSFDHEAFYPLTGAHDVIADDCVACHAGDYNNTPNTCVGCHQGDYDQSVNPNHTVLNLPTDCESCHTTEPDWMPATFDIHNDYYALNGAHATISNDCAACHNGEYNNTPNTCFGCHSEDYNNTTNPNHTAAQFSTDCQSCHTESEWVPANFDHDGQYFPIYSGAHEGEWSECIDCHTNPSNYAEFTCITCHMNPETDDDHDQVSGYVYESTACLACHPMGDVDNIFDHNNTAFPLTGAHVTTDCIDCHSGGYQGTPTDCVECHTTDFDQSTNPNHGALGLPTDCETCHTTEPGWSPATFEIHDDYFVLDGAHASISNDCTSCHNGDYNNTPNTCVGCHQGDYDQSVNPNHTVLNLPTDCESCHTTELDWMPATFDIHDDYYVLNGAHAAISNDCAACHNGDYNNTPTTCFGCHEGDYNATTNPNHQDAQFPTDCESCHTEDAWIPSTFDHDQYYVLDGAHANIANDCESCHQGDYNNTPNTCVGCHQGDYDQSVNPNHTVLNLPTDCESCHTTEPDWMPATFDIHDDYYVLNGAHAAISNDCAACHNGDYNNTPNTCFGCHENDYNATTNPNHQDAQFPTDCESCHTEDAWIPSTFDHDQYYVLDGAHANIANDCESCHQGDYNNTPNTCVGCHQQDYDQSVNPNHTVLNLPTDCESCHTTEPDWKPATFDIHDDYYVLNGAHAAISNDCAACHNGDYNNTPTTCFGCHEGDYNATTNPNHQDAQFPTDCESCHTEDAWIPSTFDHDQYYVLDGAHANIANDCESCHQGDYNNTPNTCVGCHQQDYDQSVNPNHTVLNLPTECESCHTTEPDWMPATFDIHDDYYVLNGAHAAISNDCAACHNGDYNNTPNTCFGCHENDYNATTNPNHQDAQFPTDCESCHTEDAWIPSTFDHDQYYVLDGAHANIANDCESCHQGDYNNTPNTCVGCHQQDYDQSVNPNHTVLNLPTDCESCHTTEPDWMPATFDIHDDYYVLNGAHAAISNDCTACHNGDYNNTPNTCFGCHENDYNATTNPNHQDAQFPTDCESCHTEDAWIPSTFDHDQYYVLDGAHANIANDCESCHQGDYNNTPNTCVGCHQQDYDQSVNPNHTVLNLPTDCESCHTTEPDWMPATFDIHDDYYVLNGAHAVISNDCAACHNGDYNNTPTTCFGCHEGDYNATTNPNHQDAQFPTDCESCHTEDAWIPSTFDHDNIYPLTGAHQAIENDCIACHSGGYNNTPNTCEGCHTPDYNQSVNPNHTVLNLPMDCESCHTTEPDWMPATFDIHDDYYVLNGAHAAISNDCVACHNGDYNNTPNTCFGCHEDDYNAATNPNHQDAQFPTDCESCHTEDAWIPSNFDHDNIYPLTGAHQAIENDCIACHSGGYNNTPNTCEGCHTPDYNQSVNPNHTLLNLPMDCESCHTTEPDWMPATFDIHDDYYVLNGAHAAISNNCAVCHNGDYNNTPNTCFGCHEDDYNAATNPNHQNAGFPTTCENCHTEDAWIPANWDHDGMYFPIYSGKHEGEWDECIECHTTPGNFMAFSCIDCHEHDNQAEVDNDHEGVSGYEYSSPACYSCHPNGEN